MLHFVPILFTKIVFQRGQVGCGLVAHSFLCPNLIVYSMLSAGKVQYTIKLATFIGCTYGSLSNSR